MQMSFKIGVLGLLAGLLPLLACAEEDKKKDEPKGVVTLSCAKSEVIPRVCRIEIVHWDSEGCETAKTVIVGEGIVVFDTARRYNKHPKGASLTKENQKEFFTVADFKGQIQLYSATAQHWVRGELLPPIAVKGADRPRDLFEWREASALRKALEAPIPFSLYYDLDPEGNACNEYVWKVDDCNFDHSPNLNEEYKDLCKLLAQSLVRPIEFAYLTGPITYTHSEEEGRIPGQCPSLWPFTNIPGQPDAKIPAQQGIVIDCGGKGVRIDTRVAAHAVREGGLRCQYRGEAVYNSDYGLLPIIAEFYDFLGEPSECIAPFKVPTRGRVLIVIQPDYSQVPRYMLPKGARTQ